MANIFDRDYSQASITPQQRIEDIARKSRVPVNVLLGATELAGAKDDAERLRVAGAVADEFGPRIQAGEDIKALIREAAGSDDAAKTFIDRSRQIALEQYPDDVARVREARKAEAKGGLGAALGVGVDAIQQGYGSAIEGAGKALGLEGVEKYGADVAARNRAEIEKAAPGLTGVDDIDGIGSGLKFAGEAMAQQVPQLGISIGAGMTGAAAGGAIGGPIGAAIGGIGAGIAANIPFFYGQNRERQKEAIEQGVITEMDESAALLTAGIQAPLDAIADRLMIGAIAGPMLKAGGGLFTRGVRGAAEGVMAEVPTEIGQSILERAQAGLPLADDDAIREYRDVGIAAGLIGGVVGGASGAIGGAATPAGPVAEQADRPEDQAGEAAPPAPEPMRLLPAPSQGGTIFGEGAPGIDPTIKEREDWMTRSSDVDPAQQPAQFRQSQAPGGPLRAAMQVAQPEITPVQNPGAADGQAAAPVQPMGAITTPVAPMGDETAPPVPMAGALSEQAMGQIKPKVGGQKDGHTDFTELTPDEARERLRGVEERARRSGWTTSMRKLKADLQTVIARAEGADDAAIAKASRIITTKKGAPFKTEAQAKRSLGNLGYSVEGFKIEPREGGFVAVRIDQPAPEIGGAKQDNGNEQETSAGIGLPPADAPDSMGGAAPVASGGPDQSLGGAGGAAVAAVGRSAGSGGSNEQAPERDLADAAAARKPSPALTEGEADEKPSDTNAVMKSLVQFGKTKPVPGAADAKSQEFGDFVAATVGTRNWAVGRKTPRLQEKYAAVLSQREYNELRTQYDAQRSSADVPASAEALDGADPFAAAGFQATKVPTARVMDGSHRGVPSRWTVRASGGNGKFRVARRSEPVDGAPSPSVDIGIFPSAKDAVAAVQADRDVDSPAYGSQQPDQIPTMAPDKNAAPRSKPARKSVKQAHAERMDRLKAHFTPGSIVQGYGGSADRVISFNEAKDGDWSVRVQAVRQNQAGDWEAAGDERTHRTTPTEAEFRRGVIQPAQRVQPPTAGGEVASPPDADVKSSETAAKIEAAAAETAVDPSPAQAEAENYRTGKTDWNGLKLSIENAKGSTRKKVTPDGKTAWEVTMPAHYGRILRTEGADGDHVDFYMGDKPESDWAYVVDQVDAESGSFDEHKFMLGFGSRAEAEAAYDAAFSDGKGPKRRAAISEISVQQAKHWLANGDTKKPYADLGGMKAKADALRIADDARAVAKNAKKAEEDTKAKEALQASVGRIEDLKGGTVRAIVEWGDGDRFMDAGGYSGHGKFVLRKSVFPDFDALVQAKKPTLKGDGPESGVKRLQATALAAQDEIEWRFVRNVSGKPHSVAGRVATTSPDGKRGSRWVEIDRRVHNFVQRNGLKLTAGDDPGIMAIRRADDELVGFTASIRPYMNSKGADLDAMDAIAHPVTEAGATEKTTPTKATTNEDGDTEKHSVFPTKEEADHAFASEIMSELAGVDDLFQNPVSEATTIKGVFADIDPSVRFVGKMEELDDAGNPAQHEKFLLRTGAETPRDFFIYQTDSEVWIDVSELKTGEAGSAIYAAVADYAANTGRVFIGDPEGLSAVALRRRTDAMLSSALKHRTTKHLVPHQYQLDGDARLGVPPLRWTDGDDAGNIRALIATSIANTIKLVPRIADARYDFQTGTFRTGEGQPLSDVALDGWVDAARGSGAARAGRSTLKRSILLNTLSRTESGKQPGLLERSLRQPGKLVAGGLQRTFYSRSTEATGKSSPVAVLRGDELGEWSDMRDLKVKARAWYRDNLQGTSVTNKATGWTIRFTRAASGKIGGKPLDYLLRAVPALKEIVANAEKIGEADDRYGRAHVRKVHYFKATIAIGGRQEPIHIVVREMDSGKMFYDLNLGGNVGAPAQGQMGARETRVEPELQIGADTLNIRLAAPEINGIASIPVERMRDLSSAVQGTVAAHGLAGKVTPRVVRGLLGASGIPIQGRYHGGQIEVSAAASDAVGVARHEIIHALRDPKLWDSPYGLFTGEEWRTLVRAARLDKALMARINDAYADKPEVARIEEAVAEMYREWAGARDARGPISRIFGKVQAFFRAVASALRGEGFTDAAMVMERIAAGDVGGRGPQGPGGGRSNSLADPAMEMRDSLMRTAAKAKGMVGRDHWRTPSEWLTDAMAGFGSDEGGQYSILSLVPGRALFAELGKTLMSARAYLRTKEEMDALRNAWHSEADKVSQGWLKLRNRDSTANDEMMDLMHRATLSGVDPSKPMPADDDALTKARAEVARHGPRALSWARDMVANAEQRAAAYAKLKPRFDALPDDFKALYGEVLGKYTAMGDDFEKAVVENIEKNAEIGKKRARRTYEQELRRIEDDGLKGTERQEALDLAQTKLDAVLKHGDSTIRAHLASLRKLFESNRLKGPYVPLARFGVYFVTVRDDDGKVISFSRFEGVKQQQAFIREMEAQHPGKVEHGMISQSAELKRQVDPTFVSEVEGILAEAGASFEVMDAVWQRWLETLPDQSIRTAKIHRKGREGWNRDAFRAFGKHMFHGAHQLARLKYGAQLQDHLEEAKLEARRSDNPNRAGFIVREMEKRHAFTMDPKGGAAVAGLSNLAFIWYLGLTPGAALANISQTTVVGVPLMAARFKKAGVSGVTREIGRAMLEFTRSKPENWTDTWSLQNNSSLSDDERAAIELAYRRGTIDKTQAHDLASVAETGIEYKPWREKVMKRISFLFHHTERFNREVTFLASYRLARSEGLTHASAVEAAADQTWAIHFDYANTSRPRIMQGDIGKLLTTFRNFTVNMLWRLFRDAHQMFNGATAEERAEARTQLVGITLSMMAHAGIRGTWGYGLAMSLLAVFFPGDDDDIEKWLQDALLVEGDDMGSAAWNYAMGAALNGTPGQVLGIDLRERIGMPNLWFRGTDRDLEGEDLYFAHMQELLGPVAGIPLGFYRGISYAADDQWWRGGEAAVPKVVRDAMKAGRYAYEGVLTKNGDPLLEDVNPWQVLMQMSGFTPAQVAERYQINTRLKNTEAEIVGERQRLHRRASNALRNGDGLSPAIVDEIRDFNRRYPEYPITPDSIRQSMKSRIRASQRSEFGVILNPKLNDRIRGEQPPQVYN